MQYRQSRLILFVSLFTLCGAMSAVGEPLSFEQAVASMRDNNEALKAAGEDIRKSEAERAAANGLRYPNAEAELRVTQLDGPVTVGIEPIPARLEVQDSHFWDGEITVTQPLYAGGRIDAANRAAKERVTEARAESQRTDDGMVTELARRYFGVALAQRARDVQALKVKTMEDQHFRAKRLMEEGVIARVEFLNAEVALANAKQELESAERDVTIASEGLSNMIVSDTPASPGSPLFIVRDLESREAFQSYVDDSHPVLRLLDSKLAQARQGVRAEQGVKKPTVYLFGMYELWPDDLTMLDPRWAAGIGAKVNLFDGSQSRNKVNAARATENKVVYLRDKARRDLKTLVVKQFEEVGKARDQYDAFGATITLAEENLRVRTRAFEEGMATSVEVVDATLSLARAQLGRVKAAYDFDYSLFQLLEAAGRTDRYTEYMSRGIPIDEPRQGEQK
jgi:outer membrane protein TolC